MLYFLWALLNIGLLIFFIVVCFQATKLIREKIGMVAAVIFVFGLLSFMGGPGSDKDNMEPNSNQVKTWKFTSSDSIANNPNGLIDIDLEKTSISKYSLGILYEKDKLLKNNIPVSANTETTGFQIGTSWKPISIVVNRTENNQRFDYVVYGTVKWKLLGLTVYSQSKGWKGVALLK